VSATLEVESGANDPMAVFLTVTLIGLVTSTAAAGDPAIAIARSLVLQLGLGTLAGFAGGYAISWTVNRLEVAPGLYPVFVVAAALVVFGGTQALGGSGFLAVYLAGLVAGNRRMRATRLVRRFHDGIAWISQIVMFLILGLLVTPKNLLPDLIPAGVVALALIFVARPAAVWLCLAPFSFSREERLFVAWVGLRGAVPIFLAIFPILGGVPDGLRYFNVAFLVVLASLVLQGWTIPWVARWLGVEVPRRAEPVGKLDIDLPSQLDRDVVGYLVDPQSAAAGKPVERLHLPRRTRVLAVLRDNAVVRHDALEELKAGDYVLIIAPPEQSFVLDRQFAPRRRTRLDVVLGDFVFPADLPAARLVAEYGLPILPEDDESLGEFVRARLGAAASVGDALRIGESELVIHEMDGERIAQVALRLEPSPPPTLRRLIDTALARASRLRARLRRRRS
jgi:cell volume regulation protein A